MTTSNSVSGSSENNNKSVNQEQKISNYDTSHTSSNLQNLINSTSIATVFLDRNLRVVLFTPKALDIFNLMPGDVGRPLSDISNQLTGDGLMDDAKKVLEKPQAIEREMQTDDGTFYTMRLLPYRTAEDGINGVMITFYDITEAKRAGEALRVSEERLRLATKAANIYSWEYDVKNDVYSFSDNALHILGISQLPHKAEDITKLVHPHDKPILDDKLQTAIRRGEGFAIDFRSLKEDNSIVWLSVQTTMLTDAHGKAERLIGIAQDVSKRKETEEALQYSEAKLRLVVKASRFGTWLWNVEEDRYEPDEYTLAIFNHPANGLSRINEVAACIYPVDLPLFKNAIIKAAEPAGNGILNFEFRVMNPDGSLKWVQSTGQTFFEGTPGRAVMMVGSMTDITERKTVEETLRQSEERYRAFFNQSTSGVTEFDSAGNILLANETFCTMLGYATDEMTGMNVRDFTHADSLLRCLTNIQLAVEKGQSSTIEKKLVKKDKTSIWITESMTPVPGETGITKSLLAVGIDITERKNTELFIHKAEERYRIALEAGELATWDWNLKTDKVSWNSQHFRLFGFDHKSDTIDPDFFLSFIYPEDLALVKQQLAEVVGNSGVYNAEFRIRRKDNGKLRWMTGYGRVTEREGDKPVRISGVMFDSTERRESEDALEATKNSLSTALEAAKMGVWTLNMAHGYMDRSAKHDELLGYTEWQSEWNHEIAKQNILEEDKARYDAAFENLRGNGVFDLEARVKNTDGSICWIHYFGRTFRDEDGKSEMAAGVIYDITDQKTIEKQKDEFIGVASHELKTPVTSIKAYAEILQEMFSDKEDHESAELMGKLDSQVDRLTNLIKDLLDVTKMSEGQLHLITTTFDMEMLIRNAVEDVQRTTRQHTITLNLSPLPEVAGDKDRLAQVIINMLSNAIKYSPGSKEVIVMSSYKENKVFISVQDFGIGMSPGTMEKLFARFFRSDNPSIRSFPGLGLGLFISMEIMKRHRGTISVQSEKGKGSIFTMILPV